MKQKSKLLLGFWGFLMVLLISIPSYSADGGVILNPGTLSGSVSLPGYDITSVTVKAIDTNKNYSATTTSSIPAGASSIDYTLTVEGGNDYYVIAEVFILADNSTKALIPPTGPISVAVGSDVPLNLSMEPAIISGTILTGGAADTITSYSIYAYLQLPQFDQPYNYYSYTSSSVLSATGDVGVNYALLVPPEETHNYVRAYVSINGLNYNIYDYDVVTPIAGAVLNRDYNISTNAATISGYSVLNGIDVNYVNIQGYANNPAPYRNSYANVSDVSTGLYSLAVDAGDWYVRPNFSFSLEPLDSDLAGIRGSLVTPYSGPVNVSAGDELTLNFDVNPGFIPGNLNLWGANTNFSYASVRAYGYPYGSYSNSGVDLYTGKFLFVAAPGDYMVDNYQSFNFDYPDDPDPYLSSSVYQSYYNYNNLQTVSAGVTNEPVELSYGTITVRRYFYVADDGVLSSPRIKATRTESPTSIANGYGSPTPTTEGQAIVTLLLPGEYTLEAFATVNGSDTEFGTVNITVEEGDVVVVGGTARPTIKVSNPTNGDVICGNKVMVEGLATDDIGVSSITINGQPVIFTSTNNPSDPNEVSFSYEASLAFDQANDITVTVTDTDGTDPISLSVRVYSESCGPEELEVAVDVKPGSCPNPLNIKSKGVLPVAILGSQELDVTTVALNSVSILGISPIRSNFEDVATPFFPYIGKQAKLDCNENGADGYTDLTLKFDREQLVKVLEDNGYSTLDGEVIVLPITGKLVDDFGGNTIKGEDIIVILNKGK